MGIPKKTIKNIFITLSMIVVILILSNTLGAFDSAEERKQQIIIKQDAISVRIISSADTEITKSKSEIQRLKNLIQSENIKINKFQKCKNYNISREGTIELAKTCDSFSGSIDKIVKTLTPDELFYTIKKADKPYVSQSETSHFRKENGGILATDVACGFKAELFAPDYLNNNIVYRVESISRDKLLGNNLVLRFNFGGGEYRWILGHIRTRLSPGDTIYTGQIIGEMDMSGATTGYHSHIELWSRVGADWLNISYSNKSKKLLEKRREKEKKVVKNKFFYTPKPIAGSLKPDSQKYKNAVKGYKISWQMLSAIHCTETFDIRAKTCSRHTDNSKKSSVGAKGIMQFMPKTFRAYGVDGNGDGKIDIYNNLDSLRSAANYLNANYVKGLTEGMSKEQAIKNAFYQYNHAEWYVDRAYNIYKTLIQ